MPTQFDSMNFSGMLKWNFLGLLGHQVGITFKMEVFSEIYHLSTLVSSLVPFSLVGRN